MREHHASSQLVVAFKGLVTNVHLKSDVVESCPFKSCQNSHLPKDVQEKMFSDKQNMEFVRLREHFNIYLH